VVGPVANPNTSNSSSRSSTSTGGTPDQSAIKGWWASLSRSTRTGFIVALAVGVPLLVILAIIGYLNKEPVVTSAPRWVRETTLRTTERTWVT
jgi:hypothetical protein